MVDLKELAEKVYANKVEKHFNVTDIPLEFCLLQSEVTEMWNAYIGKEGELGEEMADVMIYLLGLSRLLNVDLEKEVLRKIEKNRRRNYREVNGVWLKIEGTDGEEAP